MPSARSKLGFYYSSDDRHYRQSDLAVVLPALHSVSAGWLTLRASTQRAIPEEFIVGLMDAGVQPIIHMPSPIGQISSGQMHSLLAAYAQWGVRHVIIYDRPNLQASWSEGQWSRRNLVETFANQMIPLLTMQSDLGLTPVVPPFEPGGDYWDLAFLQALLQELEQRLSVDVHKNLTLAAYAWSNDKPLDWGAGGPDAWPEARPYHTPHGAQDHRGFRLFEWYAAIAESVFHRSLPILIVSGGTSMKGKSNFESALETNLAIARFIFNQNLPSYVEAFSFDNLYDPCETSEGTSAWLSNSGQVTQALAALQRVRHNDKQRKSKAADKRYSHYVLLPARNQHQAMLAWAEVGPYVIEHQPQVGFSLEEARQAQRVTLVGSASGYDSTIVDDLISAGCEVHQFENASSLRTEANMNMHAQRGVAQE